MKADFYFSEKQKKLCAELDQMNKGRISRLEILVDGVWREFTEQVKAGDELTSKWDDVVLVAGNFDGGLRINGIVQK